MQPPDASDAELVAQTLAGDRAAFGHLYDRYARLVRAVALDATRDWQSVPDVAQEAFLRAYRNLGRLREPARFGAWLVGIARRVADERRRAARRDRLVPGADRRIEVAIEGDDDRRVDARDELAWVLDKLADFEPRERLAVEAFYLAGQDAARAAELVGLSRSGVYAVLERAVARLARLARSAETRNIDTKP
jgi:RNA polymerase sigma-70 factor (ECF subfamily)